MRIAHQPRRRVGRLERRRPVTLIGERLIPGKARLWPSRFSSDPLETVDAVHTKDGFTQPSLMLGLPCVLRWSKALQALHPKRKEGPEIRQCPGRDVLHLLDRTRKGSDALDLLGSPNYRVGATTKGVVVYTLAAYCCNTHPRIDSQHLLDELVLPEVDVHASNRRQNRFENASRACVIAREEGFRPTTQMLGHVVRIRLADMARGLRERLCLLNDSLRRTKGLQPDAVLVARAINVSTTDALTLSSRPSRTA